MSVQDGSHPPLEVETVGAVECCSEHIGNPTKIKVTAGTVVIANVEMLAASPESQSFLLTTSMAPQ